jgi:hypothetical protein
VRSDVSHESPLPAEIPVGQDPPDGAIIDYYLGAKPDDLTLEILDSRGQLVRRFSSRETPNQKEPTLRFTPDWIVAPEPLPSTPGMHRFVWDLRYPSPPKFKPTFDSGAVYGKGVPDMPRGSLALPGTYTIRLTANHKTYDHPLTVVMDPRLKVSLADLQQQFTTEQEITTTIQKLYSAALEAVSLRRQLHELRASVQDKPAVANALETLDHKVNELAGTPPSSTVDRTPTGSPQSLVRLQESLASLLGVIDSADHAPTTQALEAMTELSADANRQIAAWDETKHRDVQAFNELLTRNGLSPLGVTNSSPTLAQ